MILKVIRKNEHLNGLINLLLLLLVSFGYFSVACALESDKNKPLTIQADSAQVNRKIGVSVYQGRVHIKQGSTHLKGDTVYVFNNPQKEITEIIAIGDDKTPAHYETRPKRKDALFNAFAHTIKYFPQKSIAFLIKQALATQGPNTFQGPLISYNVKTQVVQSLPTDTALDEAQQTAIFLEPHHLPSA